MVLQPPPSRVGLFWAGWGRGAGAPPAWSCRQPGRPCGAADALRKHRAAETCPGPQNLSGNLVLGFFLSSFFLTPGNEKKNGSCYGGRGKFYRPAFFAFIPSRTQTSLFQNENKGPVCSRMDFQVASSSLLGAQLRVWIAHTGG